MTGATPAGPRLVDRVDDEDVDRIKTWAEEQRAMLARLALELRAAEEALVDDGITAEIDALDRVMTARVAQLDEQLDAADREAKHSVLDAHRAANQVRTAGGVVPRQGSARVWPTVDAASRLRPAGPTRAAELWAARPEPDPIGSNVVEHDEAEVYDLFWHRARLDRKQRRLRRMAPRDVS